MALSGGPCKAHKLEGLFKLARFFWQNLHDLSKFNRDFATIYLKLSKISQWNVEILISRFCKIEIKNGPVPCVAFVFVLRQSRTKMSNLFAEFCIN